MMLSGPELKPKSGEKPKNLIILLHGLGADGNNLIDLARMMNNFIPDTHFISPNAPNPYDMGFGGYQWFQSARTSPYEKTIEGLKSVEGPVNDFIDFHLDRFQLTEKNLGVIGFSQGTIVALHSLLRRSKPAALIVGFSGALIGAELLDKELKSKPPVLLIHGEDDNILPISMMTSAYNALKSRNIEVEKQAYPNLGHSIGQKGFELAVSRLKSKLSP